MVKQPSRDPSQQIIEAAKKCYLADGISNTGMKDIAQTADVARSTLYRYFATKDELLVTVIKQELIDLGDSIISSLERFDNPSDTLVEGLLISLQRIPQNPLLNAALASDEDINARRVIWESDTILDLVNHMLENFIRPSVELKILQDQVRPEIMTEWIYRILLSYLTLPSHFMKTESELRATLHSLLIPVMLR